MVRKRLYPCGNPDDPQGMIALAREFIEWMQVRNFSEPTIINRRHFLRYFMDWCAVDGVTQPCEVTKPIVERYQKFLSHACNQNGDPLSSVNQLHRLNAVRLWFRWLTRKDHILYDPAADIDLPKIGYHLPKCVLTVSEAERVIHQANVTQALGIRDRAVLETLYSTGIRRMELVRLNVYDLDNERGTVMIRQGKGKRDRLIPIGERALAWIDRYLVEVRPGLLADNRAGHTLFLNNKGKPFSANQASQLVRNYIDAADIGKHGSCHAFRHTMATLMLENGADIRCIQEMLGHRSLLSTQVYTHVSIGRLKEVHSATHPSCMKPTP